MSLHRSEALFLFVGAILFSVEPSTAHHCKTAFNLQHRVLKGHVITSRVVPNFDICIGSCINQAQCYSVNFYSTGLCELNDKTKTSNPQDMVRAWNGNYLENIIRQPNPCNDKPCRAIDVCYASGNKAECQSKNVIIIIIICFCFYYYYYCHFLFKDYIRCKTARKLVWTLEISC